MQTISTIFDIIQSAFSYNEDATLIFTQFSFWIFFAVLLCGYSLVYNRQSIAKSAYLLLFSLFFYYKASGFYFVLLIFVTLTDYSIAHLLYISERNRVRKLWVALSVCINIGLLAYFKYAVFLAQIVNQVFHTSFEVVNIFSEALNQFSGSEKFDVSQLILPVGISFYTFQVLSHTIDVYRRKIAPVRNIIDFGFYVSFFPQLVAGPIVRASEFIPQIYKKYHLSQQEFWQAVFLIMNGLVKKIVISDYIALHFVDRIFDDPTLYSGFELLTGAYGYAIQIYCDFSGYTDVAIGVALLLGFRLPLNFNSPYKSHSISNFWRRWHISLSTWLRDYLYISLGGNRKGKRRTYLNLLITMLLGGLWHGASYKFIIWGGLHGVALAVERWWRETVLSQHPRLRIPRIIGVFLTFHFICLSWIFFRANDMSSALLFIERIFSHFDINIIPDIIVAYRAIFGIMAAAYILHFLPAQWKSWYKQCFTNIPIAFKIIAIIVLVFFMYQMSSTETQPFIYFQF
ncbi:alginate O-acetyltransferase [Bacteroidia bacterium]|nr:alginate O-acetyltransferase [Bacteroidia bacterium]GHT80961.1 alginate O-acetyltransferase [Bacteroidia bacterium]